MGLESGFDVELVTKGTAKTKNPSKINPSIILPLHTMLNMGNLAMASGILDEVDAEIITQSLAILLCRDRSSLWKVSSSVTICCLAISMAVTTWPYTLLAAVLCGFVTFAMAKVLSSSAIRIVDCYIRSAKKFDAAAQQVFSAIHCGEITSFRLFKKGKKKRICMYSLRVEFLEMLRIVVDEEHNASESLCRNEECESLLWAALTPEMAELTRNGHISEEFLKLASLKELWQLYFLLRSEFIRLLFLALLESSTFEAIELFFRLYRRASRISRCSRKLVAVSRFIKQRSVGDDKKHPIMPTIGTFDKARAQLQIAFELLDCKAANEDPSDIVAILDGVIKILGAGIRQAHPEVKVGLGVVNAEQDSRTGDGDDEHDKVAPPQVAPPVVSVDEVFEATSHPDVGPLSSCSYLFESVFARLPNVVPGKIPCCYGVVYGPFGSNLHQEKEVHEVARSVVHELESALEERKQEMRNRERAALARFYGKTEKSGEMTHSLLPETADSDENEELDSLPSANTSDIDDSDGIDKQSVGGCLGIVAKNSFERSEGKRNFTFHRFTASAWGNSLEEALRLRSTIKQEHFEDTDSELSERDIVITK